MGSGATGVLISDGRRGKRKERHVGLKAAFKKNHRPGPKKKESELKKKLRQAKKREEQSRNQGGGKKRENHRRCEVPGS